MAVSPIVISLVDGITAGLQNIGDSVKGLRKSFTELNSGIEVFETGVGYAISAAEGLGNLVTPAADFEDALAKLQAQGGATAEELKGLKAAAEGATETTRFTALEAAEALRVMAEDGVSAKDSIAQIGTVLAYAQANAQGAAEAALGLGGVLDGFGASASTIGQLADSISSVARAAGTSTKDLQTGLAGVGAQATAADVSISDAAAALGVFAAAGKDGTAASALLGKLITELDDPAKRAGAAIKDLGLKTSDFGGLIRSLRGDTDAAGAVMEALSTRGRLALSILLREGGASVDGMLEKYNNFAGASQAAADIAGNSFNGAIDKLSNAYEQAKRTLFEPLLAPLTAEIQEAAKEIFAFSKTAEFADLSESIKTFVVGAVGQIKEFIKEFDFKAATVGLNQFVTDVKAGLDKINGYIDASKLAAGTLKTTYSALGIAFNATQAAIGTVQAASQGTAETAAGYASLIAGAFGKSKQGIDDFAKSMQDAAIVTREEAGKDLAELVGHFKDLAGTSETASAGLDNAAVAASATAAAAAELSAKLAEASESGGNIIKLSDVFTQITLDANRSSTDIADALGKAFAGQKTIADAQNLRGQLAIVFADLGLNVQNVDAEFDKFKANLSDPGAAKRFSDSLSAVDAAVLALLTNTQDAQEKFNAAISGLFKGATAEQAEVLQEQVSAAMFKMGASIETVDTLFAGFNKSLEKAAASKAVADLSKQFADLGIKSQAELNKAAQAAEANFDAIVKGSRNVTGGMADVRAAFIAYAKTQLDAVKNADEFAKAQTVSALQGKAAAAGLTESLAELGVVGKDSGDKVVKSIDSIAPSAAKASGNVKDMAVALNSAGNAATIATPAFQGSSSAIAGNAAAAEDAGYWLGEMSAEMGKAYEAANFDAIAIANLNEELFAVRDAASERIKQLDAELARYDPLEKKIEQLRNSYRGLGDDQLRAIATRELRLDEERKRADEQTRGGNSGANNGDSSSGSSRSGLGVLKLEISNKQSDGMPINLSPEQLSFLSSNIMNEIKRRSIG